MDNRKLLKNIENDLNSLQDLTSKLLNSQDIHSIDIDILLSKIRTMYESSIALIPEAHKENKGEEEISTETEHVHEITPGAIDEVLQKKDSIEIKVKKAIEDIHGLNTGKKKSKIVVVKSKGDNAESETIELEPEIIKTKKDISDTQNNKQTIKVEDEEPFFEYKDNVEYKEFSHSIEDKTLADQFQENGDVSLHNILENKQKVKDLASKYIDKPISNIKAAININDKIWFIKELFNGDTDLYNKSLKEINDLYTLDEALSYLNRKFTWDQDSESFQSFLELVFRRFVPTNIE